MERAIGYIRVSTHDQAVSGLGLADQESRIQAYCAAQRLELAAIIRDEGVSGGVPLHRRPGGKALADAIAAGARHVVALRLDRLFRSAEDALRQTREWAEQGVSMHLIDFGGVSLHSGNSIGRMLLTVMAAFAEFERALIRERTQAAAAVCRSRGKAWGQIGYGYRTKDGRLIEDADEQRVLARIRAMRAEGVSYHAIARALNAEGVPTKDGGRWHAMTVRRILQRYYLPR